MYSELDNEYELKEFENEILEECKAAIKNPEKD